jgi:hypothetical protein
MFDQVVYLLIEREFLKTGENIFKIGKSRHITERLKSYPNGSLPLMVLPCENCDISEKVIQNVFEKKFIHRKDIGREYFEGDIVKIMECFKSNVSIHHNSAPVVEESTLTNDLIDDYIDKNIVSVDDNDWKISITSIYSHLKEWFRTEYGEKKIPNKCLVIRAMDSKFGSANSVCKIWKGLKYKEDLLLDDDI